MTSILKECNRLNEEYDQCCKEYFDRKWEKCPKCDMLPMLGTHLRPVNCDSADFVQILTLSCKCGTYPFQTKRMIKLSDYWNAHCYSMKADRKDFRTENRYV